MAGPIATAFIEIVGTLDLEIEGTVQAKVHNLVSSIKKQLDALEAKGSETARKLIKDFANINISLDARNALSNLHKVEDAAQDTVKDIKDLRALKLGGFDTAAGIQSITRLETSLKEFGKTFKTLDDGKIRIDVTGAKTKIEQLEKVIRTLQVKIEDVDRSGINPEVSGAAIVGLGRLDAALTEISEDINKINAKSITLDPSAAGLRNIETRLEKLGKDINVELKVKAPGLKTAEKDLKNLGELSGKLTQAFGSAFRRLLAFGALRGAIQGISTLFRSGVQAAGAIQTVEVTLNRFFALTKDLGQTSGQFFNNLRTLALSTPFEFEGLADTSRRILAMGKSADETIDIMASLTDAVSAVGGGQGEIDGVVRALSQLASKGRVDLQDFRQISENLPSLSRALQIKGVIDELNRLHPELNATVADFESLRQSGLITGKVLTDGVIGAIKEIPGVAGAARAASRTLQGALSNLADFTKQEFAQAFGGLGGIIADELNTAFGSLTLGSALTPLASSIREVIEAFADVGESSLPLLIDGFTELSPEVAALVSSVGELAEEAIPLLTNAGSGAISSVTGLTTALKGLTSLLGALPIELQEFAGSFATLALIVPGAGEALVAPFKNFLPAVRGGKEEMDALTKSVGAFSVAVIGLFVLQQIFSTLAKAAERQNEFNQSINDAARAFKEFETTGEAALEFVNKFRVAGEGVNLGGLENFFDGLTTGEIETALGATTREVSKLVEELSKAGDEITRAELEAALDAADISLEDFLASSDDAKASLLALTQQFGEGAKIAFDAAVSSQKFVFVTDSVASSLKTAADKSKDYDGALNRLKKANQVGAKAALGEAAARGATVEQIEAAIAANTTYEVGIDGLNHATVDYQGALQDLNEELQKQESIFQGLGDTFAGFAARFNELETGFDALTDKPTTLGKTFTRFALSIDKAALSSEQMNAIANELGNTLGQALSGEELTKIVGIFVGQVTEFKTALDSVVPSVENLQFETDSFSLNNLIEELGRIATARVNITTNINELLDEFGEIGNRALDALLGSGLDPDQFAIALEQLLAGGETKVKELGDAFLLAVSDHTSIIAERLAADGFDPALINEYLGVDAFAIGTSGIEGNLASLEGAIAATPGALAGPIGEMTGLFGDLTSALGLVDETAEAVDPNSFLGAFSGLLLNPAATTVPKIDTNKAVADATAAGKEIGEALVKSVETASAPVAAATASAGEAASTAFSQGLEVLPGIVTVQLDGVSALLQVYIGVFSVKAALMANATTTSFEAGLDLDGAINKALTVASRAFNVGPLSVIAASAGFNVGYSFGRGIAAGIGASLGLAISAAVRLVQLTVEATRAAAGISSPSKLFAELGYNMGSGVAAGMRRSVPDIEKAAISMVAAAQGQTSRGVQIPTGVFAGSNSTLAGSAAASSAIRRLAENAPAAPGRETTQTNSARAAGTVHYHDWKVSAPTDDPEAFALRVAARLESRLE